MELYNKEFVYFDWDDNLEGKKGFFGDSINHLKLNVKDNRTMFYGEICHNVNTNTDYPFRFIDGYGSSHCFRFCYYDPYYEFRKAYLEGKQTQFKDSTGNWRDVEGEPIFTRDEYRIKPSETMYYVEYFNNRIAKMTSPTLENVLFQSTNEFEIDRFIHDHEYLGDVIKAAREGKKILFKEFGVRNDPWKECTDWNDFRLHDFVHYEYRIDECTGCLKHNVCDTPGKRCKSYCTKAHVPFDSVQELIDAWKKKSGLEFNRELLMPFIWVKLRESNDVSLISDFYFDSGEVALSDTQFSLEELWRYYTFLDDSFIGKVKEHEE